VTRMQPNICPGIGMSTTVLPATGALDAAHLMDDCQGPPLLLLEHPAYGRTR
jgi:hypothetical protein